ncbi:hypothetical protein [Streptomyces huasconensis]|uniref:hypothetical protein n=1 Tax=Streptomyces huasconensis TaxID=1854574 RepID=UPI0037239C4C
MTADRTAPIGRLDVLAEQQHDSRDQQLATGHSHDCGDDPDAEPGRDSGGDLSPERQCEGVQGDGVGDYERGGHEDHQGRQHLVEGG